MGEETGSSAFARRFFKMSGAYDRWVQSQQMYQPGEVHLDTNCQ